MSFIVHANHVRNFERCFTMPDRDDTDKPTWIDWIGELLNTLDDDHYAVAFVYEHETEHVSARNIIVIPRVPITDTISQVVARSEALDNPAGILTVLSVAHRGLMMMASSGSWTSVRYLGPNNDDMVPDPEYYDVCLDAHWIPGSMFDGFWQQHKAARVSTTDGLAS